MYRYELTPESKRQLKKLSPETSRAIVRKLEFFVSTDQPLAFAKRLTNLDLGRYRFRIGDYRIIFDTHGETIVIHAIGHRSEIYK